MARRKKKSRFLTFKMMLSLVALFFIFFLVNDYLKGRDGFFFHRGLKQHKGHLKEEILEIEAANRLLQEEIHELNQPYCIEKIAREELGMAKDGEIIYYILDEEDEE